MPSKMSPEPKPITSKELEALRHIRNRIVHEGHGPSVRELQRLLGYDYPNAAAYILRRLAERGFIKRRDDGKLQLIRDLPHDASHAQTVEVPLVGSAPCGAPLLAEQNIEALIPVAVGLARPPARHFLLRARGDSMDLAGIQDGDLVLVRLQEVAEEGDRVVALIDDEATIKVFHRGGDAILLQPKSTNPKHKPIVLTTDFLIQGVVRATIKNRPTT